VGKAGAAQADGTYMLEAGARPSPLDVSVPVPVTPVVQPAARRPGLRLDAQWLYEGSGWTLLRLATDAGLLVVAVLAAYYSFEASGVDMRAGQISLLFPPLVIVLLAVRGLYLRRINPELLQGVGRIVGATSLAAMLVLAAGAFTVTSVAAAPLVARLWVFATAFLVTGRVVLGLNQRRARRERVVGKRTLIVGAGQIGAQVERRLEQQPILGLCPVGYLDADPAPPDVVAGRSVPVLGPPDELERIADETGAEHVILAFSSAPDSVLLPLVRECETRGLEVSIVPRLFESVNVRAAMEHLGGLPLYGLRSVNPKGWQFTIKHAFDRVVAAMLIFVAAPLLAAIAVAVKLSSPGPVFFRQRRIGRDGREFEILKFRTMIGTPEDGGEANAGWAAFAVGNADAAPKQLVERRTRIGMVLRGYSLDELPQLFNVLRGEMSLVGPRPELPHYVKLFEQSVHRYADRQRVRSGLTGWAQVHGLRGNTSLADRVEWDNYYVQNWSLGLDLQILLMTVHAVFQTSE